MEDTNKKELKSSRDYNKENEKRRKRMRIAELRDYIREMTNGEHNELPLITYALTGSWVNPSEEYLVVQKRMAAMWLEKIEGIEAIRKNRTPSKDREFIVSKLMY